MKNYIIEIGNFKGEQGYKFSSTKTDRSEIISEFVNSQVILGTSKFLKSVFLGEAALMNTTHPVTIINLNK